MEKEIKTAFLKKHNLLTNLQKPAFGFYHFKNRTFYPEIVPWLDVDGVYVNEELCLVLVDKPKTFSKAMQRCYWKACKIPSAEMRSFVLAHRTALNALLQAAGLPLISESFWAIGDESPALAARAVIDDDKDVIKKQVLGFRYFAEDPCYDF